MLFNLRARLGQWFGWDKDTNVLPIPGSTEASLRDTMGPSVGAWACASNREDALGACA